MTFHHALAAFLLAAALTPVSLPAQAAGATGPFTQSQATQGRNIFLTYCTGCHGSILTGSVNGPALSGQNFIDDWLGKSTKELFQFAASNMPLNAAGTLTQENYADLVAYILAANGALPGPAPFTKDSDVPIRSIADGNLVMAVVNGEGAYGQTPPAAKPSKKPAKKPIKKRS